jgi:hypothetical protein
MLADPSGHAGADHNQPLIDAGHKNIRGLPQLGNRARQGTRDEATTLAIFGVQCHPGCQQRLVRLGDVRQLVVGLAKATPPERQRLPLALDLFTSNSQRTGPCSRMPTRTIPPVRRLITRKSRV